MISSGKKSLAEARRPESEGYERMTVVETDRAEEYLLVTIPAPLLRTQELVLSG